jgi:hypothetical protein
MKVSALADLLEAGTVPPGQLRGILASMRTELSSLRGYKHPYGFSVLQSERDSLARVVRIHRWNPGAREDTAYDVHDHIYDLKSHILSGSVAQTQYDLLEGPPTHRLYFATYSNDASVIIASKSQMRAVARPEETFQCGETYSLPAGALHRVQVDPTAATSTLVLAKYRPGLTQPTILGPLNGEERIETCRIPLNEDERAALIEKIIEADG